MKKVILMLLVVSVIFMSLGLGFACDDPAPDPCCCAPRYMHRMRMPCCPCCRPPMFGPGPMPCMVR